MDNLYEQSSMSTRDPKPAPMEATRACWLHKPIAPCEESPRGLPGLVLATRPDGQSVHHDFLLVAHRTDTAGDVVGYTVARSNGRTFDFDSVLPEPNAIIRAVQALDPPPAPAPVLPFRSAADYAANDPDGYRLQCEEIDGNGPDKAAWHARATTVGQNSSDCSR